MLQLCFDLLMLVLSYTATGMREMKRERDNLCVREREGERDREQFVGKRESLTPN